MLHLRLIAVALLSTTLAACSRAPSEADIEQAYRQEVAQVNQMTSRLGAGALTIQVNAVKKQACQAAETQGHYRCQVQIDSTLPFVGKRLENTDLTLVQGERGWKILRGLDAP